MIEFSQLNEIQIIAFGLILLRMSGFIFVAAIFFSQNISIPLKVLFSLVLTFVLFKVAAPHTVLVNLNTDAYHLILLSIKEVLLGITMGFVTRAFFFSITMAGEMISVSMGLGQAQIFNPMMGNMGNVMEQFFVTLATLLYMGLNGHHFLIEGLAQSFVDFTIVNLDVHAASFLSVVNSMQSFFIIGLKISAPIVISMLVIQVGVGILSRAVPQINVIMTSAPITVLIGFMVLFISLPLMLAQLNGLLNFSTDEFFRFIKML